MASDIQETGATETGAQPAKKITPSKPKPTLTAVVSGLGMLLFEILLPAIAAGGVLLWLFGGYRFWQIGRTTALIIFAIAMIVIALLLGVVLDTLTAPFRNTKRMRAVGFLRDPRVRVVKLALSGLIIPLVLFGAVNLAPLASHGTVMNYLIAAAVPPVKLTPPDEVGSIALKAENPSTKLLSIQVLEGFHSTEALNQLVLLVNEDSSALAVPGVANTLSKAIADYGTAARDPLLVVFKSIDPKQTGSQAGISSDLYERYFGPSFDSLKAEITRETLDPSTRDAQLAQLQAAQAQLKISLTGLQYKPAAKGGSDPRLDFIMQTFLVMDIKQDADLLTFAKATAADPRYSSQVRGDALLLVGKLGGEKDLDVLYTYLKSDDDLLLIRALQAINMIQTSLSAGANK